MLTALDITSWPAYKRAKDRVYLRVLRIRIPYKRACNLLPSTRSFATNLDRSVMVKSVVPRGVRVRSFPRKQIQSIPGLK